MKPCKRCYAIDKGGTYCHLCGIQKRPHIRYKTEPDPIDILCKPQFLFIIFMTIAAVIFVSVPNIQNEEAFWLATLTGGIGSIIGSIIFKAVTEEQP